MLIDKALNLLKKHPARALDARTLEILKGFIEEEKNDVAGIAAGLAPEDRTEFLEIFAEQSANINKALTEIDAALTAFKQGEQKS